MATGPKIVGGCVQLSGGCVVLGTCAAWDGTCDGTTSYAVDTTGVWDVVQSCGAFNYAPLGATPSTQPQTFGISLSCVYLVASGFFLNSSNPAAYIANYFRGAQTNLTPTLVSGVWKWRLSLAIDGGPIIYYNGPSNANAAGTYTYAGDDGGGCSAGNVPATVTVS